MARLFQMVEERENDRHIQIRHARGCRLNPVFVADELQQQTKCVAVTGDGLRTGSFLIAEVLDEEVLQQWAEWRFTS